MIFKRHFRFKMNSRKRKGGGSLTDAQKHRFIFLAHFLQPHPMMTEHHSHGMMGRDWDDGGMHRMMGTERRGGAA